MARTRGKSTPTKDNLSSKKTNAVSSETTSSESTMDDQNFTVVSYSRKARDNAHTGTTSSNTLSQSKLSKKFKMAAGWYFGEFQKKIFELIQYVITKNTVQDHPFAL
jgi:ATP-dependent phosphoenolpyruvate carboxykinase